MSVPPFIRRVRLKNYKSIRACDVRLGPLTFLVGPNGAGKSNFLDALRFVADALRGSLSQALWDRGGFFGVRRRRLTGNDPSSMTFGMRLDFELPDGATGWYGFEIAPIHNEGAYTVKKEQCAMRGAQFTHAEGNIISSLETPPAASADRLYLVNASGLPHFRPVYDALSRMGLYNLVPDRIRDIQDIGPGDVLSRDGRNLASVIARMAADDPVGKRRVEEYLSKVVPGLQEVLPQGLGPKVSLMFRQMLSESEGVWNFLAENMSDGTLRAVGVLVALFQRLPLIGIEEPELALHPAAAGVLYDALREASTHTQVVVTSHSPDLLENKDISQGELLSVRFEGNETRIGPLDEAGRTALREHLYTPGELLRMDKLQPDRNAVRLEPERLELFGPGQ